ncbi:MAG TPA: hypothetical protein VNH17_15370, partial [Streptosporangiaceae bacterium]|nr:hypothetical protein [Streptosporangiaceae bacterium]
GVLGGGVVTSSAMLRRAIQAARLFDVPLHLVIDDPTPDPQVPELTPMDLCDVCGDTTETAPLCVRCDIAQDAAYERRQDV